MVLRNGRPVLFKNKGVWYPFVCGWYSLWFMETIFNILKLPRQKYWFDAYEQFIRAMDMPLFNTAVEAIENDELFGSF